VTGRAETERILDAFIARIDRQWGHPLVEAIELARSQTLAEIEDAEPGWLASENFKNAVLKAEDVKGGWHFEAVAWLRASVYGLAALCELIEGRTR
jgi:hypothetical protein